MNPATAIAATCAFSVFGCRVASGQLVELGPGTQANGISADGRTAVGLTWSTQKAFVWTAATGRHDFGLDAGMPLESNALAVSADGTWVVGGSSQGAFRWHGTGTFESIVNQPPVTGGTATGVSADGTAICGWSGFEFQGPMNPWYWTQSGGQVTIPVAGARAVGISRNGAVVVGQTRGDLRGFTWTPSGGVHLLQPPAGSPFPDTFATAINFDGTIVVGWSGGGAPTVWTNELPSTLPTLAASSFDPLCVNDLGTVVAGSGLTNGMLAPRAMIWTEARGTELFTTYLASFGVSVPANFFFSNITGVSADGRTFTGNGGPIGGLGGGFVVTVPAPGAFSLVGIGVCIAARRRRCEVEQGSVALSS